MVYGDETLGCFLIFLSVIFLFSRQEYRSWLPFPSPGDLPNSGIKPLSPASLELAGRFFTTEPPGKPILFKQFALIFISNLVYSSLFHAVFTILSLNINIILATEERNWKFFFILKALQLMVHQRSLSLQIWLTFMKLSGADFLFCVCRRGKFLGNVLCFFFGNSSA